ncbi:nitrite/sulfite reductase, hemoprotein beta-component, ferrodoxin-like protein [Candidatus Koribacter versatilis Ellin345]|uniref:Nitrite/sulfite reductase, hemoprotein beta-component, ferrodoxin-like protein n=1 Tax=Koribacter versatilis (strain Ellin345) TaxID=204669 RepID=Q1IP26_KORVE|nr:nitrite/sulfite reductase [Candidatus Koribacter versatilis]ABF41374.1 nitrite/sulfite reductase, hemoprotein beta-component, ferrodoxin-like protein [Candidatus Koribacter versatilis Ellin345]
MPEVAQETKAQRVERLKREKNAWERIDEIRTFAREGWDSIPPEWLGTYFRSWGVYTQGDGVGAVGGKGGEGRAVPFFMVRIRIPNGILTTSQLRVIADVSRRYARGIADITVRQNVQLHWVKIEDLPDLLAALENAGLTTLGACGDVTRNITGCPLAGVDGDEIFDASPIALELNRLFVGNAEFYNLPRKFKISITGCRHWCTYPEINDVGLTAVIRRRNGVEEKGFSIRVGGGLSTQPFLGVRLNAFVPYDKAVVTARTIAEIFRDQTVLRESREQARLKFLFLKHGWSADAMLAEVERRLSFHFDPAEPEDLVGDEFRDHIGIHPQRQPGLSYVGASVLRGRTGADQLSAVADLADRYGNGEIRTTTMQNLIFVNVPSAQTGRLAAELEALGLQVEPSPFWRGAVACTGTEFCKLAITETKSFTRWLVDELEERAPEFTEPLRINVTGCPNSCGQHWISDLGLEGKKLKVNGVMQDAYYFCVGGAVGLHQAIARPVGYRCLATDVPDAIARLLSRYLDDKHEAKSLREFLGRHTIDDIRGFLAGTSITGVPRDVAAGPVPHGVEG